MGMGKRENSFKKIIHPNPSPISNSLRNHCFPDPSSCELWDFLSQSVNVMETCLLSMQLPFFQFRLLVFSQLSKSQVFGPILNGLMMPTCTSCCCNRLLLRDGLAPWKLAYVHSHCVAQSPQIGIQSLKEVSTILCLFSEDLRLRSAQLSKRQALPTQSCLNTQNRHIMLRLLKPFNLSFQNVHIH